MSRAIIITAGTDRTTIVVLISLSPLAIWCNKFIAIGDGLFVNLPEFEIHPSRAQSVEQHRQMQSEIFYLTRKSRVQCFGGEVRWTRV